MTPDVPAPRTVGPITRADIVRYAGASGDLNTIHYDDEAARAAGFPGVLAMGMYPAALLATYLTDWLGAANVRRFRTRFHEPVWPGDVLTLAILDATVRHDEPGSLLDVAFEARRHEGGVAVSGNAVFRRS